MVNKADGDNRRKALVTRADYEQILHYLRPATEGWSTGAYTCSAITKEGIQDVWNVVLRFKEQMEGSPERAGRPCCSARRRATTSYWSRQ